MFCMSPAVLFGLILHYLAFFDSFSIFFVFSCPSEIFFNTEDSNHLKIINYRWLSSFSNNCGFLNNNIITKLKENGLMK